MVQEDNGAIGKGKRDLYSRSREDESVITEIEGRDYDVTEEWLDEDAGDEKDMKKKKKLKRGKKKVSIVKNVLIVSMIFFIAAASFAIYQLFSGTTLQDPANIDLLIVGPAAADSGEEVALQLMLANRNTIALENVSVYIEFPQGSKATLGVDEDVQRIRKEFGTIEPGVSINETIYATFFGEENEEKFITADMEYRFAGSNPILEKAIDSSIVMASSPIYVDLTLSDEAVSSQDIEIVASIQSESSETLHDLLFDMDYPFGFVFDNAAPEPRYGDSIWHIDTLPPYGRVDIVIFGNVEGQDNEERVFKTYVGTKSERDDKIIDTILSSAEGRIVIKRPFIGLHMTLNGVDGTSFATLEDKSSARANVRYVNNTDSKLIDVKIEARAFGDLVIEKSLNPYSGHYISTEQKLIWDQKTKAQLAVLEPGQTGSIGFGFQIDSVLSDGLLTENPNLRVEATASARRLADVNVPEEVPVPVAAYGRVATKMEAKSRIVRTDGPIRNTGPLPPKVDETTTYTVIWTLTNRNNDVEEVVVRSSLPTWVRFSNKVVPDSALITFDEISGDIIWNVGTVPAGAGITRDPVEVAFQIAFTPGLSQLKSTPTLLNNVKITGVDTYVDRRINIVRTGGNISISEDSQFHTDWRKIEE